MSQKQVRESKHFDLVSLADGVYACIHKPGGGALSNAGIIDLGGRTLLVDAMGTVAAGRDLRASAEALFGRPVFAVVLTHPHSDHWIGASVFGSDSLFHATEAARAACVPYGEELVEDYQDRAAWEAELREMEQRLATEQDERMRVSLANGIAHTKIVMADMADYVPRYPDLTFAGPLTFHGEKRVAEVRPLGRGHSADDIALLLPDDGIAFIGDVGFFGTQPFLADSDMDLYREQLRFVLASGFRTLVPGHGPVGGRAEVEQELAYFDVMEELVGKIVARGGSLEEAKHITLPAPFDAWLVGGMNRFTANVGFLYKHFGGVIPAGT
jgi:cyclase